MTRSLFRLLAAALVIALGAVSAPDARAQAASEVIARLNANIIRIMQNAERLGYDGRYKEFEPIVAQTFDMPFMTQAVLGRFWNGISEQQRGKVVDTFRRYTVSLYADRFDNFNNQRFEILGEQVAQGNVVLVRNRIVRANGRPTGINYLVRPGTGGRFQAIDVYLNEAISEVALRRSEFGSVLQRGGVDALVSAIEGKIQQIEAENRVANRAPKT